MGQARRKFAEYAVVCGTQIKRFDPFAEPWPKHVNRVDELDALFDDIDALVIAAALTEQTVNPFTAQRLTRLPDGGIVVNVARGGIVDRQALFDERLAGRLRAGLDVPEPNYLPPDHPVRFLRNCLLTCHGRRPKRLNPPHIGRTEQNCLDNIQRYFASQLLKGTITPAGLRRMT